MKTLEKDYLPPKQFSKKVEALGDYLRRISFSLWSSLLLAFVLASLVKTRLYGAPPIRNTYSLP